MFPQVRHREFLRNLKRELSKLVSVVSGYGLVSTGVRILCADTVGKRRNVVLQTHGKMEVCAGRDEMDPKRISSSFFR